MPTSIPTPPTLSINVGDVINYKGVNYAITNVGAAVDDGKGKITYALTLTGGTIITVSAETTVIQNPGTKAANTGVQTWVHGQGSSI